MPYFSIKTDNKIVIELPEFPKNLNDMAIFKQVIPQFSTEEFNFLRQLSAQGCQPIVLNTLTTFINASVDDKNYLEKFYENLTLTTYNFAKILALIDAKKTDEKFIADVYSKLSISNRYKPIKAEVFIKFLQHFINNSLTEESLSPLFLNITNKNIEAFINTLSYTIEKIKPSEKFILNDWFSHLSNIQQALVFNKVIINDIDISEFNAETLQKITEKSTQFNTHERHSLYLLFVTFEFQRTLEKRFGFQSAIEKWETSKQKGIDGLMTLIEEHGYLIVGGYFGKLFHNNQEPEPKNETNFRYYCWPKNSFSIDLQKRQLGHNIIVIGAQKANNKNSQDLVFFLDPTADKYKEAYRIFAISYNSFSQRLICDNPLLKFFSLTQHTLLLHPKLKPSVKLTLQNQVASFWHSPNCKTIGTAVTIGVGIAATTLGYALSMRSQ